MYVKLFEKILDSSIWLEPDSTLRVWITMLASMNEDGFCAFACEVNLGRRANVKPSLLRKALDILSKPDPQSSDPEHEGRRIERVPGGWMVLNAKKYREMANREDARNGSRERVARHRAARNTSEQVVVAQSQSEQLGAPIDVTSLQSVSRNATVTQCNASEAEEEAEEKNKKLLSDGASDGISLVAMRRKDDLKIPIRRVFEYYRQKVRKSSMYTLTTTRGNQGLARFKEAAKMAVNEYPNMPLDQIPQAAEKILIYVVDRFAESDWHMGRDPKTNGKRYDDWELMFRSEDIFQKWADKESLCKTTTS